jgi:hypothetical protein
MRTAVSLLVGVLCLAVVSVGARQGGGRAGGAGAPQPPQVLTPGPAQILGRVVNAGTTSGIAGAVVILNGPLGPSTAMFTNGIPGGARRMYADGQGQFFFRDLPAGTYAINSTAAGYVPGQYGETRVITIRRTLDLTRALEITATDTLVPVQIQMWRLGGISGRVLDEAGEPVVGVPVTVVARMTDWGGPIMQQAFPTVQTDDRGLYHADVTPGDYIVGVQTATSTVPISVFEGAQQAMLDGDQALRRYLTEMPLAGDSSVMRGMGVRVGNYSVSLRSQFSQSATPPVISAGGRLMLLASSYHPSSTTTASATVVTVRPGEEKSGVDIRAQLIPARRISGHVSGPNGPGAGLGLMLIAPDPAVTRTTPATIIDTPQAVADANGDFAFIGVVPGSYTVRVFQPETSPAIPLLWAVENIAVPPDGDLDGLQITLKGGVTVSGQITVETSSSSTKPPTSQQLRAITVVPRPVPGSPGSLIGAGRTATQHPDDSRFTTVATVPGAHMMMVTLVPPGYVLKSVTSGGQNIGDKPFELPPSGLSNVMVTITDRISTLSGLARDAEGRPVPAATIAVFPADKSLWRLPGMLSRRVQTAAPGRDGRYTFRGLPAGDYIVVAADWPSADFSDGDVLTRLTQSGVRVTLGDGENRTQDLPVVVIK